MRAAEGNATSKEPPTLFHVWMHSHVDDPAPKAEGNYAVRNGARPLANDATLQSGASDVGLFPEKTVTGRSRTSAPASERVGELKPVHVATLSGRKHQDPLMPALDNGHSGHNGFLRAVEQEGGSKAEHNTPRRANTKPGNPVRRCRGGQHLG